MSTLPLREAAALKVSVRLAQVDQSLREEIAEVMIELMKLSGPRAIALRLFALSPRQNPEIKVPLRKYNSVILNKKIPPGKIPEEILTAPIKLI